MKTNIKKFIENYKLLKADNSEYVVYAIYEITGLWKYQGHDANLLTYKASINGLKGWNIPTKYRGCFKLVKFNQLTSFLYWEDE